MVTKEKQKASDLSGAALVLDDNELCLQKLFREMIYNPQFYTKPNYKNKISGKVLQMYLLGTSFLKKLLEYVLEIKKKKKKRQRIRK